MAVVSGQSKYMAHCGRNGGVAMNAEEIELMVVEKDSNSRSLSVFRFLSSLKYGILVMREIVPERKAG